MAKLRNISDDELQTTVSGQSYITAPDAILEVPDDVYLSHAWPESLWAEVDVPSPVNDGDTISEVKARVEADSALAHAALEAENAKDEPRKTLVAYLEQVINDSQEG